MPSGGARPRSGPPPDPQALRRDRPTQTAAGLVSLPFEGRQGPAPTWPLRDFTVREEELWLDLWRRPQAVMWEKLGQDYEVAFFVRKLSEAEVPKASVELRKSIRADFDSLGLSVVGMKRNGWQLTEPATEDSGSDTPDVPKKPSARSRLKVVGGD